MNVADKLCRPDGEPLPGLTVRAPDRSRLFFPFFPDSALPGGDAFRPVLPRREWPQSDKQLLLTGLLHLEANEHFMRLADKVYAIQMYVMRGRYSVKEVSYALRMIGKKDRNWRPAEGPDTGRPGDS